MDGSVSKISTFELMEKAMSKALGLACDHHSAHDNILPSYYIHWNEQQWVEYRSAKPVVAEGRNSDADLAH